MSNFFGTDGIRGEVGKSPITADILLKVGWAVGSVLKEQNENPSVIIGKDTRVSGYLFESALEAGFLSAGVNVGMLGPMPSPAIAYLTQAFSASAGVVISASHNPYQDNGVKFFSSKGVKLNDETQKAIEKKISMPMSSVGSASIGKARRYEQALGRYIEFCKSTFDKSCDLSNLKIIIDCANGATYHIAEDVFSELGASVSMINNTPDGYNINRDCGATDTKHLQKEVLENNADLGIAFDGDGDRLIMVDHKGQKVDGDELVFIIANAWKAGGDLKSNKVVGTKMTNLGIQLAFAEIGVSFIEADVGDRHVMDQLIEHKAVLGGEGSGHIICLNKSTSGDGIIAALQVLEVMSKTGKTLLELKSKMTKYPQVLINVKTDTKVNLQEESKLSQAINSVESKLSKTGRVLVRESGTEPLVRVMVESSNYGLAKESAEELAKIIQSM
ncbi:phosphoglucosamine mutase [Pseudothioglobus sp. nBUS_23]|uniref:phosphoglucosamine mutase n=1 Tax=Pseudothioglobus sp. nBUS_23 TaxID=3395318 RepID=UPI003EBBA7F7